LLDSKSNVKNSILKLKKLDTDTKSTPSPTSRPQNEYPIASRYVQGVPVRSIIINVRQESNSDTPLTVGGWAIFRLCQTQKIAYRH